MSLLCGRRRSALRRTHDARTNGRNQRAPAPRSGTIVAISPWNFPLAIFAGQIVAALVGRPARLAGFSTCLSFTTVNALNSLRDQVRPFDRNAASSEGIRALSSASIFKQRASGETMEKTALRPWRAGYCARPSLPSVSAWTVQLALCRIGKPVLVGGGRRSHFRNRIYTEANHVHRAGYCRNLG